MAAVAPPSDWLPILHECVGTTEGAPHLKQGSERAARFFVRSFQFQGLQISWLHQGEAALIAAMIGAPIDPDLLMQASSVNEALGAIAQNTSVLLTTKLAVCHKQPRSPASSSPPLSPDDRFATPIWPPAEWRDADFLLPAAAEAGTSTDPASLPYYSFLPTPGLDSLPPSVLQLIVCLTGSAHSADALACVSRSLAAHFGSAAEVRALERPRLAVTLVDLYPIWSAPATGSCPSSVVSYDAGTRVLRKTARLGNPIVFLGDPVFPSIRRGAFVELKLERLRSVGGIQLGVMGLSRERARVAMAPSRWLGDASPSAGSEGAIRFWCDGAGRIRILDGPRCGIIAMHGEQLREGDTLIGAVFTLRGRKYLAFAVNGALMGKPVQLPHRTAWHFFTFFDSVEAQEARVISSERRAPLLLAPFIKSSLSFVPRPLERGPRGGALVLVRTVGPLSRGVHLEIEGTIRPEEVTVAQVACAVSRLMDCDEWHRVELRLSNNFVATGKAPLETTPLGGSGMTAGGRHGAMTLSELGITFDPTTGTQSHDLLASLPVLFA